MFTGHYNGQCDTRFAAKDRFPRNRQTFVDKEEKKNSLKCHIISIV